MGKYPKVVWAELVRQVHCKHTAISKVENSAQVKSC
jgi:hypothetical protein